VVIVESVPEAVLDHRIDELQVTHLCAVAHVSGVSRLAHAFLAAGDDDSCITRFDLLHTQGDGAKTRTADLIDAPGRGIDRNSGADGSLPRGPLALSGGQHLAEDHLGNVSRLNFSPLQGCFNRNFAKFRGRQ
jgi:hypothetical protein